MPRRRSHLCWPREVPKGERRPLDALRCFYHHRQCVGEEGFNQQDVVLKRHMLLLVSSGQIVVEHDGSELPLYTGDGCLFSPGTFKITEAPAPPLSFFSYYTFFFNDAALGKIVGNGGAPTSMAQINTMHDTGLFPLLGILPHIRQWLAHEKASFGVAFIKMMQFILHLQPGVFTGFLKHRYYIPRGMETKTVKDLAEALDEESRAIRMEALTFVNLQLTRHKRL